MEKASSSGKSAIKLLRERGLKDTLPRRLVITLLESLSRAASPQDIQKHLDERGQYVNIVTVYRILATLERIQLVHRHPCNGLYSLCTLPDQHGHHGFLHCIACGHVDEFADGDLCKVEDRIARSASFKPVSHVSEIVGTCLRCQPQ